MYKAVVFGAPEDVAAFKAALGANSETVFLSLSPGGGAMAFGPKLARIGLWSAHALAQGLEEAMERMIAAAPERAILAACDETPAPESLTGHDPMRARFAPENLSPLLSLVDAARLRAPRGPRLTPTAMRRWRKPAAKPEGPAVPDTPIIIGSDILDLPADFGRSAPTPRSNPAADVKAYLTGIARGVAVAAIVMGLGYGWYLWSQGKLPTPPPASAASK